MARPKPHTCNKNDVLRHPTYDYEETRQVGEIIEYYCSICGALVDSDHSNI